MLRITPTEAEPAAKLASTDKEKLGDIVAAGSSPGGTATSTGAGAGSWSLLVWMGILFIRMGQLNTWPLAQDRH